MERIEGRGAVVIGGGSGIGRGISLGLARSGARTIVADIDPETAEQVATELRALGADAHAAQVDATARDSLAALADFASEQIGPGHILSNNVGVLCDRRLDSCSETDWAWSIESNLMSIVRGVDTFLPRLREHGEGGHIVNTASMAAVVAPGIRSVPVHLGLYVATKHAILGYSEILRDELAEEGIGVSVLCPGLVQSNLARTSARFRPERYGGAQPDPGEMPEAITSISMPQEEVGPIVVRAIRGDRLHIFTHPKARAEVEKRQRRMLDDFDFAAEPLEES